MRSDWEAYQKNGVLAYLLEQKKQGIVRQLIRFLDSPPEERDYGILGTFTP